jgi:hypothetical protein
MKWRSIFIALLLAPICVPALTAAQQQKPAPQAQGQAATWPMEQIQGFHVVLVVGETARGNSSTENLTEAAARALKDMGEFLPYKSYRVLDAQWSSCCSGPQSRISGRLQGVIGVPGPNGSVNLVHRPYVFSITARSSGSGIQTRFVLTSPGDGHSETHQSEREDLGRMLKNVADDLATMEVRIRETRRRVDAGVAPALELREAEDKAVQLKRQAESLQAKLMRFDEASEASSGTGIMDSSFTMDAGETVVVGTSKLGGDKALIAVVTAVKKGGAAR